VVDVEAVLASFKQLSGEKPLQRERWFSFSSSKSMIPWCNLYVSHTTQSLSLGCVCYGYANWAEPETNTAYSAYSRKYFELYHWRKSPNQPGLLSRLTF